MNSEQFISIIRKVVRDSAVVSTIENLSRPPGRRVPEAERLRADWFNGLGDDDQSKIHNIVTDAVDEALFGFLSVIDGSRAIESGANKGKLLLFHANAHKELLNDPDKTALHDIFNEKD